MGGLGREGGALSRQWGSDLPRRWVVAVAFAVMCVAAIIGSAAQAAVLPSGFHDTVAFSGLTNPTAIRFSPDGRVFVAEKSGLLVEYDSLADTTPTTVADFRSETDDYHDRGLLGLALDPH